MLRVALICLLAANMVMGQISFSAGHALVPASASITVGSVVNQGYLVKLTAPGWIYSDPLALAASASQTPVTVYTTLISSVGTTAVGLMVSSGNGGTSTGAACSAPLTTHAADTSLKGLSTAATVCPADFLTLYTATTAGATTSITPATITLTALSPIKWLLTPPAAATPIGTACIQAAVTTVSTATVVTKNPSNACDAGVNGLFSLFVPATQTVSTFAFYVELEAAGTSASVCFQSAAQYALSPGNCSSPIVALSGFLAVLGVLAAIFIN